jgi:hypothetical protein
MDFAEWIRSSAVMAAGLIPFNMSISRGVETFGIKGRIQTGVTVLTGLALGVGLQIASFGTPTDFGGWFFVALFGLMVAGGSIGTYEVIKKAANKESQV